MTQIWSIQLNLFFNFWFAYLVILVQFPWGFWILFVQPFQYWPHVATNAETVGQPLSCTGQGVCERSLFIPLFLPTYLVTTTGIEELVSILTLIVSYLVEFSCTLRGLGLHYRLKNANLCVNIYVMFRDVNNSPAHVSHTLIQSRVNIYTPLFYIFRYWPQRIYLSHVQLISVVLCQRWWWNAEHSLQIS